MIGIEWGSFGNGVGDEEREGEGKTQKSIAW